MSNGGSGESEKVYFHVLGESGARIFDVYAGSVRIGSLVREDRGWLPLGVFLLGSTKDADYYAEREEAAGALIDRWTMLSKQHAQRSEIVRAIRAVQREALNEQKVRSG